MTQVELFESSNIFKLQHNINAFIAKYPRENIIDIKYNQSSSHLPRDNDDDWNIIYTAMVIYDQTIVNDDMGGGVTIDLTPQFTDEDKV